MNSPIPLLARADLLLLLADGFRTPAEARPRLADLAPADLVALVHAAHLPDSSALLGALETFLLTLRETDIDSWSDEFHRLFEGAMVCPLNETAFVRRDKGAIIGDLAGYYRAFGWAPRQSGEKADHLLTELEFLAVLFTMAARAPDAPDPVAASAVTAAAIDSFVANHLGDWFPAACDHLAAWTTAEYYRALAHATRSAWQSLSAAQAWPPPTPSALSTPTPTLDDTAPPDDCPAAAPIELTIPHSPRA